MRIPLNFAAGLLTGASLLVLAGAYQDTPRDNQPILEPGQDHVLHGAEEPDPPPNQTYAGTLKCASCHFDQYQNWRKEQEKHAKAFDILPAAYKEDPSCLRCHTTGYGHPTGYKKGADRQFAGIACESCHGPGSAHVELSKTFTSKKDLTPELVKAARDSIYRMVPENICVSCHITRAHGTHPEFNR
jgi:hypothetical protein